MLPLKTNVIKNTELSRLFHQKPSVTSKIFFGELSRTVLEFNFRS